VVEINRKLRKGVVYKERAVWSVERNINEV